ncbi:MAG: TrbI/VirB10 family protein [Verrucomicrobiota bacterium]
MNPRHIISFFKTRNGMLILFATGLLTALGVASTYTQKSKAEAAVKRGAKTTAPLSEVRPAALETDSYTLRRNYAPASFGDGGSQRRIIVQQAEEKARRSAVSKQKPKQPVKPPPIQFLRLSGNDARENTPVALVSPGGKNEELFPELKSDFAPYGRLLRAKLVTTVDSSNMATPVIGLVTHDLYWNNRLLIPANSEIHATAVPDRVRNRIEVNGKWVVILAPGGMYPASSELILQGLALDMDLDAKDDRFGLSDGSAGLRGTILTNENTRDTVKLFAATFLAGTSEGLTDRQTNAFGTSQVIPSLKSGALQGSREIMEKYASRIMELIERDGAYVRVPSGKQFYLYIRETLQLSKARLGATLASNALTSSEPVLSAARADWEQAKQAELDARRAAVIQQMTEQTQRIQNMKPQSGGSTSTSPKPAAATGSPAIR